MFNSSIIEDNTYVHVIIDIVSSLSQMGSSQLFQILPVPQQNASEFCFSYNVCSVVAYPAFNWPFLSTKLKVKFCASECTRIEFQNFPAGWGVGGMP